MKFRPSFFSGVMPAYKKFVEHSFLFTLVKRNECGRISFRSVSVLGAYLVLPRDPKSQVCTDLVEIEVG